MGLDAQHFLSDVRSVVGINELASLLLPDELASPEALVAAATKLGALASVDLTDMLSSV